MIQKILFATDFSRLSSGALVYCGELAKRIDAEVVGVHALKLPQSVYSLTSPPQADYSALQEEAGRRLDQFFDDPALKGVRLQRRLGVGIPQQVINDLAEEEKAGLILLAKSSRAPVERFFVGSVTERVLRAAVRPVLVVPETGAHTLVWRPIVCGLDFSACSVDAFEHAVRFAAQYRAELALVHVVDVEPEVSEAARHHLEEIVNDAEGKLKSLAGTCGAPRDTPCLVRVGRPAEKLIEAALELGSDLLVVGSRGELLERGVGAGGTVFGAIRAASIPVLVVP